MNLKDCVINDSNTQFHIFDSYEAKDAASNEKHKDIDFQVYNYNTKKNGKPKAGDWFIYRRPGKSTRDRKFEFFGGGRIATISPIDASAPNLVQAKIDNAFYFVNPLRQGDAALENYAWVGAEEQKRKKENSWSHFFNQYGMNRISKEDFFGLFGDLEISSDTTKKMLQELNSEETVTDLTDGEFSIEIKELFKPNRKKHTSKTVRKAPYKIDYVQQAMNNQTLGFLGEVLILEQLGQDPEFTDAAITHVSVTDDSLGYDVQVEKPNGELVFIEVKTTKSSNQGDFYLSAKEMRVGQSAQDYRIYRLYNFNPEKRTADLVIYHHPFQSGCLEMIPTQFIAKLDKNMEEGHE